MWIVVFSVGDPSLGEDGACGIWYATAWVPGRVMLDVCGGGGERGVIFGV